ncbi:Mannan endo-1,6-alpha-mannosidase [Purpureocillium takamizusanense]|uniref:Mannan endo-1,6-alpha-mannosidase n=1 Tax=Purpureocillium takamizusanense TaxID=2060973 RepID=A0A9Q8VGG7_9HYPO|nr:Mannan endo-1,6-alpha-mannosidase [Purpureocillium takamizusanense]UNI24531.1 Mannan endo-1,6-alpha-mannosidase [Purpureocillium takamizusanense]
MKGSAAVAALAAVVLSTVGPAAAKESLSLDSDDSTKQAAGTLARDLIQYYHGNETGRIPGLLPGPPPSGDYYWYQGAVLWGSLIDYWHATGDAAYNKLIVDGLLWQQGQLSNFMPLNWTAQMGNDDQGFWALAAMLAAERGLPNPVSGEAQWLNLSRNVFDNLVDRYDDKTCGGGLRWMLTSFNNGYNYKNSISNGVLFSLGARLARFTGNKTYADWADKTWNWMTEVALIDSKSYAVYDGAMVTDDCKKPSKIEFSYTNAIFTMGAAYMYNYTDGDSKWQKRVEGLANHGVKTFFPDGVATEVSCERQGRCTTDMKMFKGLLHQWYAAATQVAPFLAGTIAPVLKTSARAAVKTCTHGSSGTGCDFAWANGTTTTTAHEGEQGASEEMSALSAVTSLLMPASAAPLTAKTAKSGGNGGGGNDAGNGGGGGGDGKNGTSGGGDGAKKDGSSAGIKTGVEGSVMAMLTAAFVGSVVLGAVL